jgi:hypothetical protein
MNHCNVPIDFKKFTDSSINANKDKFCKVIYTLKKKKINKFQILLSIMYKMSIKGK